MKKLMQISDVRIITDEEKPNDLEEALNKLEINQALLVKEDLYVKTPLKLWILKIKCI